MSKIKRITQTAWFKFRDNLKDIWAETKGGDLNLLWIMWGMWFWGMFTIGPWSRGDWTPW